MSTIYLIRHGAALCRMLGMPLDTLFLWHSATVAYVEHRDKAGFRVERIHWCPQG